MSQSHQWSEEHGTAIHEAGHALALFLQHRSFRKISIVPDGQTVGRVHRIPAGDWFKPDAESGPRTQRRLQEDAVCALAGPAAERRWTSRRSGRPSDWRDYIAEAATSDFERAADLADHASGSPQEAGAWIKWVSARADTLLAVPAAWLLVEAVALELLDRQQLSGAKFKTIVRTTLR